MERRRNLDIDDNPAQIPPDDVLADVLSRLPPRSVAVSRCVCTAWRAVVDARRLLRAELLPLSVAGIFVNGLSDGGAGLFSRPWPKKKKKQLVGSSSYPYPPGMSVEHHCNGLLLICYNDGVKCVLNPATGWRSMALPERPQPAHAGTEDFWQDQYLVFDPTTVSSSSSPPPHFEVFLVPRVPWDCTTEHRRRMHYQQGLQIDADLLRSQWPLSPYILNVFSSATGRWEKRAFHRDGEGAGTVADMRKADQQHLFMRRRNAVYFRGALYVHCEYNFVMRMSLSTNKYHMIKPPPTVICEFPELHLGKSSNGIYFALVGDQGQLWVWILAETNGQAEWILRPGTGAALVLPRLNCIQRFPAPWILHNVTDTHVCGGKLDDKDDALAEHDESEWNSDSDEEEIVLHNNQDNNLTTSRSVYLEILAFHPFKEIIFLQINEIRALAYHLNSSKLEDLGDLGPNMSFIYDIGTSFPYTPCWI